MKEIIGNNVKTHTGVHGIIRDESQRMLVVDTPTGRKHLIKRSYRFLINHQWYDGKQLEGKHEEHKL